MAVNLQDLLLVAACHMELASTGVTKDAATNFCKSAKMVVCAGSGGGVPSGSVPLRSGS
jgi:uncharacterized protein YfiM (DUF2279 family)